MYGNLMKTQVRRLKYGRAITVTMMTVIALTLFFSGGLPFLSYCVSSPSMEPEYKVGCFVLVVKCPFSAVKPGDVIAFKSAAVGGRTVLHRAVRVTGDGIITKGDNGAIEDGGAVTESSFIGKEVFHLNIAADYFYICRTVRGKILYVVLPAAFALLLGAAAYFLKRSKSSRRIG